MFVTPESFPQVRQRATLLERDLLLCPPLGSQVHQVHTSDTRFKKKTKENMFGPHTCLCFSPPSLQSSAADVFYCVFNRWNDSNGTDRRQVRTTSLQLFLFLCCLFLNFLNCFHLPRRDRIRAGLEQLRMVQPGGDTYMHRGFQRVRHLFLQWETHNAEPSTFKFIDTDA